MNGIAATIPAYWEDAGFVIPFSVFISNTPTSSYVVDSYNPTPKFTFKKGQFPDGTPFYWTCHGLWDTSYTTHLAKIDGYSSQTFNSLNDALHVLINTYYK